MRIMLLGGRLGDGEDGVVGIAVPADDGFAHALVSW